MITTSSAYKDAIKAAVRSHRAKMTITWTDNVLDPSIVVTANDENRASKTAQVTDSNNVTGQKWAHLSNTIKADGTCHPMPSTTGEQVGYYGATRCDGSGLWSPSERPTITVTFNPRPIAQLSVAGDTVYNEYPIDFDIELYGSSVLLLSTSITGNSSVYFNSVIAIAGNVDTMILTVRKWSTPNRIAKIVEFYTDFEDELDGDDIVNMRLLEERVLEDGSLPIGNISANEIDLTLQNINFADYVDPFFPSNPDTPYNSVLTKNRKVTPYIGIELPDTSIEYIKLGTFWTGDWKINEQSAVVNVSARDRMELLRLAEYKGSITYEDVSLYDLMAVVLNSAKNDIPMSDLTWSIDTELQSYLVSYGWLPKSSYFQAIKTIVTACMGQAYMSREDVLIIEGPSALIS